MLAFSQAIKTALSVLLLQGTLHVLEQAGTTPYLRNQAIGAAQHLNLALNTYLVAPPNYFHPPPPSHPDTSPSTPSSNDSGSEAEHSQLSGSPSHSLDSTFVSVNAREYQQLLLLARALAASSIPEFEAASTLTTVEFVDSPVPAHASDAAEDTPSGSSRAERSGQTSQPPPASPSQQQYLPWFYGMLAVAALFFARQQIFRLEWSFFSRQECNAPDTIVVPPLRLVLEQETDEVFNAAMLQADTNTCVDGNATVPMRPVAESSGVALRRQAAEAASSSGGHGSIQGAASAAFAALTDGWSALSHTQRSGVVQFLLACAHPCVQATFHEHSEPVVILTRPDPARAHAALSARDQLLALWPDMTSSDQSVYVTLLLLQTEQVVSSAPHGIVKDEQSTEARAFPAPTTRPPLGDLTNAAIVDMKEVEGDEEEEDDKEYRPTRLDKGKGRAWEFDEID